MAEGKDVTWSIDTFASSICPARNMGVVKMLESDATHLLTIDDDVWGSPGDLHRLLSAGQLVATGVTPTIQNGKSRPHYNIANDTDGIHHQPRWLTEFPDGTFPVAYCGGSCLLVHRAVYEQLDFPWYEIKEAYGNGYHTVRTEDIVLCDKLREISVGVMCVSGVQLSHSKEIDIAHVIQNEYELTRGV